MHISPARAHMQAHIAASRAAAEVADGTRLDPALANGYEIMLAQLAEHRRQLKRLQSIERKIEAKRKILPEYAAYIAGALQADRGGQDDVIVTVLVWHIDTGDLAGALPIVAYALRHGLVMPDQYQRSLACLVAEEAAELALKQLAASTAPDLAALHHIQALTAGQDMPDEVRAKLHKAIGYALRASDPPAALYELGRALALNPKAGVKKDIERLEREVKKAGADPAAGPDVAAPAARPGVDHAAGPDFTVVARGSDFTVIPNTAGASSAPVADAAG